MIIKNNSWHYILATKLGGLEDYQRETDICSYGRKVALGMLGAAVAACLAGAAFFFLVVLPIASLIQIFSGYALFGGGWMECSNAMLLLVTLFILVSVVQYVLKKTKHAYQMRHSANPVYKEPGFVSTWYKAWKGKYCTKIEIEKVSSK